MVTLCFDFGNTRLKCAVFIDGSLQKVEVLQNDTTTIIQDLITLYKPDKSILSSVIKHNIEIEPILASKSHFHKLNHFSKLPLTTPVGKPSTIGADRLAISAASVYLFPENHTLSIGLGTCITYNFTNKSHEFLGGGISPGMHLRFKSMNEQTALLPLVIPQHDYPLVGYDTNTNLQSGVILGISKEIDGIIELYKEKYDNLKVLMTGGDMPFFTPHLQNKIFTDANLLFKGLYAISECNA